MDYLKGTLFKRDQKAIKKQRSKWDQKQRSFLLVFFWIMFVVPAILHYDIPRKILSKAMPILEQLDHSMKYERRSILDKKDLLVDVKLPTSDFDDLEQEDEYLKSTNKRTTSNTSSNLFAPTKYEPNSTCD